jgi:uncharacterized membrane protein YdjX (TVP38/TMEM64 family)
MDALIIFACIFIPTFVLNLLSAGRDQLLFQTRAKASRWFTAAAIVAASAVLLVIGLPPSWVLALVLPGPLASILGDWAGSGNWIVLRHRLGRLMGQRD